MSLKDTGRPGCEEQRPLVTLMSVAPSDWQLQRNQFCHTVDKAITFFISALNYKLVLFEIKRYLTFFYLKGLGNCQASQLEVSKKGPQKRHLLSKNYVWQVLFSDFQL